MSSLINICCGADAEDCLPIDTSLELSQRDFTRDPMEAPVPEPSFSEPPDPLSRLGDDGALLTASKARFSANGDQHNVQIRLVKNVNKLWIIRLEIDGVLFQQVTIRRRKYRGNVDFHIDGMEVDFFWDLSDSPMDFEFRTITIGSGSEIHEDGKAQKGYSSFKILGPTG